MGRGSRVAAGIAAVVLVVLAGAAPALARDRVVTVEGVARGDSSLRVEIVLAVSEGENARAMGNRALAAQNAKPAPAPPQSGAFTLSGLVWDVLPVVQNYNPAGETVPGAGSIVTATQSTWSSVRGSAYRIRSGGTTTRCPSLVKECRGPQRFDAFNDVGWARLSRSVLGVTWFSTSIDEADMAVNQRFAWSTGCTQVSGAFDLQTVVLHENGHVAGLGHSGDPNAVMFPSYQTARCALSQDDMNGLATLY
jgi:Matrixin